NIWLRVAKLLQREPSRLVLSGHGRGCGKHPVRANEIATLPKTLARQPNCLVIIASDELGIGGDPAIDSRERIARAEVQHAAYSEVSFSPPSAIGERHPVRTMRQREVRMESQCQLELGQRIVEAPFEQMRVAQRVVSPRVLAVGLESGKRGAFGDGRSRCHVSPTHVSTEGVAGGERTERLTVVRI